MPDKYGALTTEAGRLEVTWRTYAGEEGERLVLEWRETGLEHVLEEEGPIAKAGGYGRELIERALPYVMQARTHLRPLLDGPALHHRFATHRSCPRHKIWGDDGIEPLGKPRDPRGRGRVCRDRCVAP